MLTSGGTEVVFLLHVEGHRTAPSVRDAVLAALHTTPGILAIEAYSPLRFFVGHQVAWQARISALTAAEISELAGAGSVSAGAHGGRRADDVDRAIIGVLADDGRATVARVAGAVGVSESNARRRLDRLRACSLVYFDVVVDERVLGYEELVLIWMQVPLDQLDELGRRVATHAPVAMATALSGNYDLLVAAACRDRDELYDYLTGDLARTIGSAPFRTSPVLELVKRG
ncbi:MULTISPECIES: Lrp/AsnC family transcriptional regulator [unclassified Isoptericola]